MTELEKAAEAREIDICQYSTNNCLNTNDCHRCQWGVPSLDLRCSNNASFKLGAQWQANQSPWIRVEESLPETSNGQSLCAVLIKTRGGGHSITANICVEFEAERGYATHWMYIPE